MRTIYFIRHGQDKDNAQHILNGHRNRPLTSLGKRQARQAAKKLRSKKISIIYSSPLKRCRQTASIISEEIGNVPVSIEPLLIERDFGILTGKPVSDVARLGKKFIRSDKVTYFTSAPKAEPFGKLLIRAKRALKKILKNTHEGNILIVAHNDIGKMLQAAARKRSITKTLRGKSILNSEIVRLLTHK